jgi:hypothetical protein
MARGDCFDLSDPGKACVPDRNIRGRVEECEDVLGAIHTGSFQLFNSCPACLHTLLRQKQMHLPKNRAAHRIWGDLRGFHAGADAEELGEHAVLESASINDNMDLTFPGWPTQCRTVSEDFSKFKTAKQKSQGLTINDIK